MTVPLTRIIHEASTAAADTGMSPIKSSCQIKNTSPYRWMHIFRQGVRGLAPTFELLHLPKS